MEGPVKTKKELLYDGVFYDITNWVKRHPGGKIIELYSSTGEDSIHAVQQFHNRSSKKVMAIMKSLPHRKANENDAIKVEPKLYEKNKVLTKDFLELFQQLQSEGMFKPAPFHVFLRVLEISALFIFGCYLGIFHHENTFLRILGVCSASLGVGRGGWVQHEGGHHSLTGIPKVDRLIQNVVFGVLFGMSGSWWISQHSRHHAMPQHIKHDVDLQTLPLLAFNTKVVKNPKHGLGFFVQNQKWLFFLCDTLLVTLFWKLFLHPKYCLHKQKYADLFFMSLHYSLIYYVGFANFCATLWLVSIYLIGNFALSHTHLPVTDEMTHWVEYSLCHTANIRSSWWVDYWMGYLNYQIEHHLFPTMPQFKNKLCRDRVKALAKKHNLPYHLYSYNEACVKTYENMAAVSKELALE